jgi:acyl dehydratase
VTQTSEEEVPLLVHGRTWEEMTVGSSFRTAKRTITETDLVSFLHVSGINEPLFYDAGHPGSAGYAGRLVPGALVYVFAEGLILQTNVLHGTGLAFMSMEYSISAPTFVGDTIHAVVSVLESRPSSKDGRGVVTSKCSVVNQRGVEVATFTPVRLIRGRDFGA